MNSFFNSVLRVKPRLFLLVFFVGCGCWQASYGQKRQSQIKIDPSSDGRVYLGIGALSAGASSRLLIDYPEPQRSQLLDLLFKPKFGASIQMLKVEIGGNVNSTAGTEPSHAHTRHEFLNPKPEYFQRGYEWWLMKEAKKRNPTIELGGIQWGAPGWIGDGVFYSQDNIDFLISFYQGAKLHHDLTIDYVGIWNERKYDVAYIKNLRRSLDQNSLQHVKVVAADQCCGEEWSIADDVQNDPELLKAIDVFGDHYPERGANKYQSDEFLKATGKPIENAEGGPWRGDWEGFEYLVKMYNRDYVIGKMTRQITWSLITSYYDNLSLPGSGLMKANTPWSGFFDTQPATWAAAHTTQFADIGWRYLDDACGIFDDDGGSYVTLVSPGSPHDYSIIVETMDATQEQHVAFVVSESLSKGKLSVWKTTVQGETFVKQTDIRPRNGKFSMVLEPKSVYSITTTTGQQKGGYDAPEEKPFPFPYKTDFEEEQVGKQPKYFSDQSGVFEVHERVDGNGKCLQQVMRKQGIEWESRGVFVSTVIGDMHWRDYEVATEVNVLENTGSAKIMGRVLDTDRGHEPPQGYWFEIHTGGNWSLYAGNQVLKSGKHKFGPFEWHNLVMKLNGDSIRVFLNDALLVDVQDDTYTRGMAGLGSGFNVLQFDNFSVKN